MQHELAVGRLVRASGIVDPATFSSVGAGSVDRRRVRDLQEVGASVSGAAQGDLVARVVDACLRGQRACGDQPELAWDRRRLHDAQPFDAAQVIPAVLALRGALLARLALLRAGCAELRRHDDGSLRVRSGSICSRRVRLLCCFLVLGALLGCFARGERRAWGSSGGELLRRVLEISSPGQRIGDDVLHARDVLDLVVELSHLLDPAREAAGELRHRLVILERIVVGEQREGLLAVEVLAPVLARLHQREELLLARVPVELRSLQLARHVGDRLQPVAVILLQGPADGVLAGVAVQRVRLRRIGNEQHRRRAQRLLQRFEGAALRLLPCERVRRLRELGERQRDLAVVLHEAAVEASESEERAHIVDVLGRGPLAYGLHLVLRHRQPVGADAMA